MKQWQFVLAGMIGILATCGALGQGTRLWTVDRSDALERGTLKGVQIRNDGRLEAGPAISQIYDSSKSYAWALATDPSGNAYLGLGGTAANSAVVMKVSPDGKAVKVMDTRELAVQAITVAPDGSVIAATSPDGKVYRLTAPGSTPAVVFDASTTNEKPKYLWDVTTDKAGNIFIAAGAPAVVYRIGASGGKPEVLFHTADQHIRSLLLAPDGMLWAGSDGSGVIYRIDTKATDAKPYAVYAAPRREITALARDEAGNIYAAGVGAKGSVPLPPLSVTGNVGVSITFVQPGSATAAGANALVPDGSDVYRITVDGTPSRLVQLKEDVVYSLATRNGALYAGTGNRGRIYRIETGASGRFSDIAHLDAAQGMAFAPIRTGLLIATSNSGKLFSLSDKPATDASYTSEVYDAQQLSQWGRVESRIDGVAGSYELSVRTGNVESPLMGWSNWVSIGTDHTVTAPTGRYAQWKAVFHPEIGQASIDSVALNFLPRNVAPVVDEIVVQTGARMPASTPQAAPTTVQVAFPQQSTAPAITFQQDPSTSPLTAQRDKNAVTARWMARDDNGDEMMFSVWYRGVGEKNWKLLKEKVTDRYLSFDSSQLPDGSYTLRVVASDSPTHVESDALTSDRESSVFMVDTTPPVPGPLNATLLPPSSSGTSRNSRIHASIEAHDANSPIVRAEYAVDAGPWQYVEPVGKVSDSPTERYDFTVEIPSATTQFNDPKEHVIAVRIYDRYDNMATAKAVVR